MKQVFILLAMAMAPMAVNAQDNTQQAQPEKAVSKSSCCKKDKKDKDGKEASCNKDKKGKEGKSCCKDQKGNVASEKGKKGKDQKCDEQKESACTSARKNA